MLLLKIPAPQQHKTTTSKNNGYNLQKEFSLPTAKIKHNKRFAENFLTLRTADKRVVLLHGFNAPANGLRRCSFFIKFIYF